MTRCKNCGVKKIEGDHWIEYCYDCRYHVIEQKRGKQRRKIAQGKICYFCEHKKRLEPHHIDADRKNDRQRNIMMICVSCHRKLHGKIYKKIYNPLIRKILTSWQKEHPQN